MHNFIKILIVPIILIFLYGCSDNTINIYEKKYSGEGYEVSMEIPELREDTDFANKFNSEYITFADNTLNSFIAEAENTATSTDSLSLKQEIKFNKNGLASIVGDCETFTGGPHTTSEKIVKNIDTKNGIFLSFKEMFSDDTHVNRINSYISTLLETNPEKFDELWKTPTVSENQNFYITPHGLVLLYPPYELSYYSKGLVELEIPYKEIESYLNPDYSFLSDRKN